MSERPNDQPTEDELEPDAPADAAADGTDELDLDAETDAEADAEGIDPDELAGDEPTIEEGDAALQAAAGDDVDDEPADATGAAATAAAAGTQTRPMRPSERRAMRAALDHGQLTLDPAHRVSDRASAVFVLLSVAVFVLVMLNGMVLGKGGFLTPIPTPSPVPSATATPIPSATATPSASAAPTGSPTTAPTATPTVAPTATPEVTSPPPSATPGAS